mmetsp:Transcript_27050/g.45065  ORF Transcript_27050/g.45065 Transcript_27050/m.45065 type:complete len:237 (+) Transcript_27050:110-820(+)|eukprot:CAMPEP_0119010418 /NCGR_PEP_ID=MMETSP1176-20130426/4997_1 /TAXON_ID=265551 /ORGANISM="Synedropsis recta cf, Strain CCMP1620" /LENGTH=236 /DNA_ID=CAMNT_0006963071 /DNA_START=52 /DNA_END=762 /DNA_ORIENTATION=+
MNVIAEIHRINELELEKGLVGTSASWHAKYAESAWVYVGNLPINLTEGDVLCILSQFGEIEDINLVRDEDNGKSRGFAFVKYEDAKSCVLAVDNLTGTKVLGRSLRVDHCEKYRLPKEILEKEEKLAAMTDPGHAYQDKELANSFSIQQGHDLFAKPVRVPVEEKRKSVSKEEHKEAKRKRKEGRNEHRQEREERRQKKEEKKREKRAKRYQDDGGGHREKTHKKKRRKEDRPRED